MNYNKKALTQCFDNWSSISKTEKLPLYDELPSIDLYMDQVIVLVNRYILPFGASGHDDNIITQSMINNYVKFKTVPRPFKKRYSKIHIAYIIMICILKSVLSMSEIKKMIPVDIEEDDVKRIYDSFVENFNKAYIYITEQTKIVADPILADKNDNHDRMNDLVMQVALSANIFKCLIDRIIFSQNE